MKGLEWNCEICGEIRPDDKISVFSFDQSIRYDLPEGTLKRNINHCNDKPECVTGAKKFKLHEDI